MKKTLLAAVLAALTTAAEPAGHGSLAVQVRDPTGAAVPGAAVTLVRRGATEVRKAGSNALGEAGFSFLPPGEYLVSAEAPGLSGGAIHHIAIQAGSERTVEVELDLARVATQVQVTAAGTAQTVDEQAKALDVVDGGELLRRGEYSVAEAIRTVPGIRVQQLGGPGSFTRILSRGLRSMDTSVLIDGFRLRDAAAPQGDASSFTGDLLAGGVDRVEVLRGSGSSLYGTHATGAVVNVLTDQGGGGMRGEVAAEGGGLGMARGMARLGGGALHDRLRYTGSLEHLNVTRGVDGDDRARNSSARGFAAFQATPRTSVTGRLLASRSFAQLNDSPFAAAGLPGGVFLRAEPGRTFTPSLNDPDNRRSSRYLTAMAAVAHALTPSAMARVAYQGVATRRDARDGPAGMRFEPAFNDLNRFDGRIDTLQSRLDRAGRRMQITAGYEFEREAFENVSQDENPAAAVRVDARSQIRQRSHAIFAQDQLRLAGDRLQISLSGRMQDFTLERPAFAGGRAPYAGAAPASPPRAWTGDAAAAYYAPASGTKVRAHAGNSYRAPALFERFGASFFFGEFSAYGDPRLAPERTFAVDGGIDQYVWGSRLRLSGTYFYTRLQEVIAFDFSGLIEPATDPYGRFGGYRNTGGGIARGFEFSAAAAPARGTSLNASYTYTNSDERRSVFSNGALGSVRVSDHMFTAVASQRVGRRFDLSMDLFAASDYVYGFGARPFIFDGPVKADIVASYTLAGAGDGSVRLFTRIENVLDRTYYEDGFRTPGVWAVFGVKAFFGR